MKKRLIICLAALSVALSPTASARVVSVMGGTTASYTFFPKEIVSTNNQLPKVAEGSPCANPAEEGKAGITSAGLLLLCKAGAWKRPLDIASAAVNGPCANPADEGKLAMTASSVGLVCQSGQYKQISTLAPAATPPAYSNRVGSIAMTDHLLGTFSYCVSRGVEVTETGVNGVNHTAYVWNAGTTWYAKTWTTGGNPVFINVSCWN
jgi:hypothetical protein